MNTGIIGESLHHVSANRRLLHWSTLSRGWFALDKPPNAILVEVNQIMILPRDDKADGAVPNIPTQYFML